MKFSYGQYIIFGLLLISFCRAKTHIKTAPDITHKHYATFSSLATRVFGHLPEYAAPLKNLRLGYHDPIISADQLLETIKSFFYLSKKSSFSHGKFWTGKKCPARRIFDHGKPYKSFSYPFVQKLIVPPGSKIGFIGDLHGSIHSLLRNLCQLIALGYLDNNLVIKNNFYLIFTGDFADSGRYGVEVFYTILRLKLANWNRVLITRGNHETSTATKKGGFFYELQSKYPHYADQLFQHFCHLYELMPCALYLSSGNGTVQCCHGGIETGYNPTLLMKHKNCSYQAIDKQITVACVHGELTKKNNFAGLVWSDFVQDYSSKPELAGIQTPIFHFIRKKGYIGSVQATYKYLEERKLNAIFRGHQDMIYGLKLFFQHQRDYVKMRPLMKTGIFPFGPFHWTYVVSPDQKMHPDGFLIADYAPIFTFTSAAEGRALPYDCFGIVTTANDFKAWRLKAYEYALPTDRNQRFVMLDITHDKNQELSLTYHEKPNMEPLGPTLQKILNPAFGQ